MTSCPTESAGGPKPPAPDAADAAGVVDGVVAVEAAGLAVVGGGGVVAVVVGFLAAIHSACSVCFVDTQPPAITSRAQQKIPNANRFMVPRPLFICLRRHRTRIRSGRLHGSNGRIAASLRTLCESV